MKPFACVLLTLLLLPGLDAAHAQGVDQRMTTGQTPYPTPPPAGPGVSTPVPTGARPQAYPPRSYAPRTGSHHWRWRGARPIKPRR